MTTPRRPRPSAARGSSLLELTLVRHGQTRENLSGTLQGQSPVRGRLTALGLRQAEAVGEVLRGEHFDGAFCSPLERAVLTLSRILPVGPDPMPLVFAPALREIDLGVLHGEHRSAWLNARGDTPPLVYRPEGGESWMDLQARVVDWYAATLLGRSGRYLIVAHGGVNRALITHLRGEVMQMPWAGAGDLPQGNGCINRLRLEGPELIDAQLDLRGHLAGLAELD